MRPAAISSCLLAASVLVAIPGAAQQTVPFESGSPVAPAGFEPQPIPAEPIEYDTAEVMRIRVVPVARGLVNPWSLAFLPDGSHAGDGDGTGGCESSAMACSIRSPFPALRRCGAQGRSGLMDVVLHPQFATNRFVYFTYLKPRRRRRQIGVDRRARALRRHRRSPSSATSSVAGTGVERPVAARVGPRRQALHDHAERRERQQLAGSEQPTPARCCA